MELLKNGNKGIQVKFLTYKLKQLGCIKEVTNVFNHTVKDAVITFQRKYNFINTKTPLDIDGVVGSKVWKALGIDTVVNTKVNPLKYIIIHCADTPEGKDFTYTDVYAWHTNPEPQGRGWSDIAYGILIGLKSIWYTRGDIKRNMKEVLLNLYDPFILSSEKTFGTRGHNHDAIDICYIGGKSKNMTVAKDTLTDHQAILLKNELLRFIEHNPTVLIGGHNQFSNKDCPSFDTIKKLKELGIPDVNIYKG